MDTSMHERLEKTKGIQYSSIRERLEVIDFYRNAKEYDLVTKTLKPLSLKQVAEKFYIQVACLKRWLKDEEKLREQASNWRTTSCPLHLLQLGRRQLIDTGVITMDDWNKV